jgi:hypothetical protein
VNSTNKKSHKFSVATTQAELDKLFDEAVAEIFAEAEREGLVVRDTKDKSLVKYKAENKKHEVRCTTCKRMRDVGEKCWWCGCR